MRILSAVCVAVGMIATTTSATTPAAAASCSVVHPRTGSNCMVEAGSTSNFGGQEINYKFRNSCPYAVTLRIETQHQNGKTYTGDYRIESGKVYTASCYKPLLNCVVGYATVCK